MQALRALAAVMDQRVGQLEAAGITGEALIERMLGHLPDLQQVWAGADDQQLAMLCQDYPGFYQYASLTAKTSALVCVPHNQPCGVGWRRVRGIVRASARTVRPQRLCRSENEARDLRPTAFWKHVQGVLAARNGHARGRSIADAGLSVLLTIDKETGID